MSRSSADIQKEIEDLGEMLLRGLELEGGVYAVDLEFFAGRIGDLKRDLRIALSVENNSP